MKKWIFCLAALTTLVLACKRFDPEEQAQLDEAIITNYLAESGLSDSAVATGTGLYYWITRTDTGGSYPTIDSIVKVAYSGFLTDSTIFDENADGATFPLSAVIEGWQQGIPLFREGGAGMLLIPSGLGYGNKEVGDIPKNSVLIFQINLMEVSQP